MSGGEGRTYCSVSKNVATLLILNQQKYECWNKWNSIVEHEVIFLESQEFRFTILMEECEIHIKSHRKHPESISRHAPRSNVNTDARTSGPIWVEAYIEVNWEGAIGNGSKDEGTHIWIMKAWNWQSDEFSPAKIPEREIRVATFVARLPKVAKNTRRLIGLRNILIETNVAMTKKHPRTESTEATRSAISRPLNSLWVK